jgi:hypothetical protein
MLELKVSWGQRDSGAVATFRASVPPAPSSPRASRRCIEAGDRIEDVALGGKTEGYLGLIRFHGSIPIGMDKYNKKNMIVIIRDPDLFRVEN